jgi:hypothetical protein
MERMMMTGRQLDIPAETATDDELEAAIRADASLVQRSDNEAGALFQAACSMQLAPMSLIHRQRNKAMQETQHARAQFAGHNLNSAGWYAAQVKVLRISIRFAAEMRIHLATTAGERLAALPGIRNEDARLANLATQQAIAARAPVSIVPSWSAADFILTLAQRGVVLSLGSDDSILATSAHRLSHVDRATLVEHKAAIIAALSDVRQVA